MFRTIAQKMPYLLIPLINEVFGTDYGEGQDFIQLRNEHYERFGKVITDSIIQIDGHFYHIECQSERDGNITVRMMEYGFAIAVEHTVRSEDGIIEIDFPESCVRYEHFLKTSGKNKKKTRQLLEDYAELNRRLAEYSAGQERAHLYVDMIELISEIAEYVIPDDNPIRERLGDVMGGRILTLRSEELRQEGRTEGRAEEKRNIAVRMQESGMPIGQIAAFVDETVDGVLSLLASPYPFFP